MSVIENKARRRIAYMVGIALAVFGGFSLLGCLQSTAPQQKNVTVEEPGAMVDLEMLKGSVDFKRLKLIAVTCYSDKYLDGEYHEQDIAPCTDSGDRPIQGLVGNIYINGQDSGKIIKTNNHGYGVFIFGENQVNGLTKEQRKQLESANTVFPNEVTFRNKGKTYTACSGQIYQYSSYLSSAEAEGTISRIDVIPYSVNYCD